MNESKSMIWIIGIIVIVVSGAIVLRPLLRGTHQHVDGAEKDIALYKAQLAEMDSDLERGVISKSEADSTRLEISRRILAADKRAALGQSSLHPEDGLGLAGVVMIGLGCGVSWIICNIGQS